MPCYHPLSAMVVGTSQETGKKSLKFLKGVKYDAIKKAHSDNLIPIPCGQCIGCRLERSRQWAMRCMFEASEHDDNTFITLTYNNDCLPNNGSLNKRDFQLFMKRLRKKFGNGIRYFHCGEYGEKLQRPHHHACLFNFDFKDRKFWKLNNGVPLYTSKTLDKLWGLGYTIVGDVTFESAAYVARYITKKINGENKDEHYKDRIPEYNSMSRRPGIAKTWFDKYKDTDVYNHDMVVVREGIKCKPPKYFDKLYDLTNPERLSILKDIRIDKAKNNPDNGLERLGVREKVKLSKIKNLRRSYETQRI